MAANHNVARNLIRDVRNLNTKLNNLEFFTEVFRENNLQIYSRVLVNLDLLNREVERIDGYKHQIKALENKVEGLEGTIKNILNFLGIEERGIKETILVSHRGFQAVPKTKNVAVQSVVNLDVRSAPETKDVATNTEENEDMYPPPTDKMREMEGKPGSFIGQTTLMCSPSGKVEWIPTQGDWQTLRNDGTYLRVPDIILSAQLGGWIVRVNFRKQQDRVGVSAFLKSLNYNDQVELPLRAHVEFEVKDATTQDQLCTGGAAAEWNGQGVKYKVPLLRTNIKQLGAAPPRIIFNFSCAQ